MKKNFKRNNFVFLLILISITSCDCFQHVSGTIMDKETGKPLEGVTVYNKNKDWIKITTDSTGHFELSSISGGFRCPPISLIIEKENYSTINTKIPSGGIEIIQLEKNISLK